MEQAIRLSTESQSNLLSPTDSTSGRQSQATAMRERERENNGSSVKPRVMTSQSSVNFPKIGLKTAQNGEKYSKKQVMRAGFALVV